MILRFCQKQEEELGNFMQKLGQYKIGVIAVLAFAVVAFANHGWFAG
jgi:hypothetical protein